MIKSSRAKLNEKNKVTNAQVEDIKKSSLDPIYFIENHANVKLWRTQKTFMNKMVSNSVVCKHPRLAGTTSAIVYHALWESQMSANIEAVMLFPTTACARHAKNELVAAYSTLKTWIRSDLVLNNPSRIVFDNDCSIDFLVATPSCLVGRSSRFDRLYISDVSTINSVTMFDIWVTSGLQSIPKIICHSVPSDRFSFFFEIWEAALNKRFNAEMLSFSYSDLENADPKHYAMMKKMSDPSTFKNEFDGEFAP